MKRTLLVGLDAACWEYLNPLLEAQEMPCLQRLIDSGVWGTLHSTIPAWTPTAWASICTGKNPGKHGIFDMQWRRPDTLDLIPIDATMRRGTPFWRHLNERQVRVGLVNVPFSYPPTSVDGFCLCGFGTPNSARQLTYPAGLLVEVESAFGRYEPSVDIKSLASGSPEVIFSAERQHQLRQVQIAAELARQHPVDVLVINLMFTDHANHKMPAIEQIQAAYRASDADLAALIDSFQPDNVMVISDHGSNRLRGSFLLGTWLRDHDYYATIEKDSSQRSATLNWLLRQWIQTRWRWSGLPERVLRSLTREILLRLPERLNSNLWQGIEHTLPFAREHIRFTDQPDYAHAQVVPGSIYSGLLYINQMGSREINVAQNGYGTHLMTELAEKLAEITDPVTRDPIFSRIYRRHDLYSGPAVEYAPDLILDSYDSSWNVRTRSYSSVPEMVLERYFLVPGKERDFGWHGREGIFIFSGSDFSSGPATTAGHVMDIPASLLHLYGVPVPQDYDGQVLRDVMSPELRTHPVSYQNGDEQDTVAGVSALSPEEAVQIADQLRALGYLE